MTVVASNFGRRENDLYQTEPWATEALLRCLPPIEGWHVWEPAAGNHRIADVLVKHGARVTTSDIETYDRPQTFIYDFLSGLPDGPAADAIITNPPYGKGNRDAVTFAKNALALCDGWVALLLTAKFDFGKTRCHLFSRNRRFYGKVALLDRIQWFEGATTGTEDHAWYIWRPADGAICSPQMFWEAKQ